MVFWLNIALLHQINYDKQREEETPAREVTRMPAVVLGSQELNKYVGGLCVISADQKKCRGKIDTIEIEGEGDYARVIINFEWLTRKDGDSWPRVNDLRREISLHTSSVFDVRKGVICLTSGNTRYFLYSSEIDLVEKAPD